MGDPVTRFHLNRTLTPRAREERKKESSHRIMDKDSPIHQPSRLMLGVNLAQSKYPCFPPWYRDNEWSYMTVEPVFTKHSSIFFLSFFFKKKKLPFPNIADVDALQDQNMISWLNKICRSHQAKGYIVWHTEGKWYRWTHAILDSPRLSRVGFLEWYLMILHMRRET